MLKCCKMSITILYHAVVTIMSHGKPAEAVEMLWVMRGQSGSQGLDIQGFIVSKLDSCGCHLSRAHRVTIVIPE